MYIFDFVNCMFNSMMHMCICNNKKILYAILLKNVSKAVEELPDKGEIEADRKLEIKLNCGTLMVPTDGILDLNVNLQRNDASDQQLTLLLFHS